MPWFQIFVPRALKKVIRFLMPDIHFWLSPAEGNHIDHLHQDEDDGDNGDSEDMDDSQHDIEDHGRFDQESEDEADLEVEEIHKTFTIANIQNPKRVEDMLEEKVGKYVPTPTIEAAKEALHDIDALLKGPPRKTGHGYKPTGLDMLTPIATNRASGQLLH
ncbi:hypothetical protein BDZ94DRAFT_1241955 [Collybia nuda]|uniref:Uncharacterized protein n=1 Tax=Collybia nuda TaxID=64659 RepID=A0A9P5XSR1_9AGAR|nr:hypothetical protein BDZ94DRAFT_1241955 [Collybia nuda]